MKNPVKLLTVLITQWAWASRQKQVCRAAFMAHYRFDDKFTADLIHAVLMHSGDWRLASETMSKKFPACGERIAKFKRWAQKITEPAKRGLLLEWKGGAL